MSKDKPGVYCKESPHLLLNEIIARPAVLFALCALASCRWSVLIAIRGQTRPPPLWEHVSLVRMGLFMEFRHIFIIPYYTK